MSDRRNWLKQTSLACLGIGIVPLEHFDVTKTSTPFGGTSLSSPIFLRSNENPYGPSAAARTAMAKSVNSSNRYNWELTTELISAIALKNKVTAENILLGAGSTELLELVARYCAKNSGNFVLADPTYNYWTEIAEGLGLKKIAVPLTEDKHHDLTAMLKAITPATQLVYLCNPNNPTGTICETNALLHFVKEATKKTMVLVDEAYLEFTNQASLAHLVQEHKNLIIVKTFSKIHGLAGARVGYGMAHPATVEKISRLHSFNNGSISIVSLAGALAAINDEKFVSETYALNQKVRAYTIAQLQRLHIPCIPSHSNFVYFSLANYKKDFFEQLEKNNIVGTKIYEENGQWSRITIGTMEEMQQFIKTLE